MWQVRRAGQVAGGEPLRAADVEHAGTVVIPGWRDPDERPTGPLLDALRRAHDNGARVVSICSGVFVLAAAGLLGGRPATMHWRYVSRLTGPLETSDDTVERIARSTGFGDAATLRHHFRAAFGTSPTSYRRRFAAGEPQEPPPDPEWEDVCASST